MSEENKTEQQTEKEAIETYEAAAEVTEEDTGNSNAEDSSNSRIDMTDGVQITDSDDDEKETPSPAKKEVKETQGEELGSDAKPGSDETGSKGEKQKEHVPKGVEKRIDAKHKEMMLAKSETTVEKAKVAKLEQELADLKAGKQNNDSDDPAANDEDLGIGPEPHIDDYATNEEFADALADHKIEKREAKAKKDATLKSEAEEIGNAQVKKENFTAAIDEQKVAYSDYDEVVLAEGKTYTEETLAVMLNHENGAEIIYHIAKDPKLSEEVKEMNTKGVEKLFNKIGESIDNGTAQFKGEQPAATTPTPQPANITKAPAPPPTLGGVATQPSVDDDDLPMGEYFDKEKAKLLKKQIGG